ncbi:MAG: ABC transporter ATP-binding protein [Planctomycetes bacterium]|nr:ABC transporter ATP-binding protein [Planctomycetota bacterium]
MVVADNVHKSFGPVRAVRGVSFELLPGQVAGLLGPNGAGKTTTIRMIVGCLMPDQGRVLIEGRDTADASAAARARIGYLPESTPLYMEMRVADYLTYRARLYGFGRATRKAAVDRAIERCWLKDVRTRRISQLSKGYKQRVGLASALVHNPPVLVLDEPTNGLDPTQIRETRQLVRELATDRTMLLSSHILPEVAVLCDRVIVVSGGVVRADAPPAMLGKDNAEQVTYIVQARIQRAADEEKFIKLMSQLPFVDRVDRDPARRHEGEWIEWRIDGKPGAPDLREAIATASSQTGILLRELRTEAPNLERAFLRLIEKTDGGTTP